MFLGEFKHTIDNKGRLAIPAKFRTQLSGGAIITRGLDKCLFLFPQKEWENLASKITNLPISQSDSRAFARLMLSGASDVEFDSQGRILIPDSLRQYSGISNKAVVTGLYNRIEIWDEIEWSRYKSKTESASDQIAEKLGQMGI
ncbi:MAG TPA: division/cell wall cluster transcriptional repressor MraZ [Candidatus Paceibacterota bacterium]|nr:division/cell wall cluster transcriptional repressor MraZ [Candidatus Paceibacterota bacterium]